MAVLFSAGALLTGCSSDTGDRGADRTQQQSEQLQDRIKTTQIDR
jgi:outer membrane biogenesis lipoprotein LolB